MAAPVFPRVHHQQALHHTKGRNLALLLKVSRSGYYKWSHTQQQRRLGNDDRAAFYDDVDRKIHQIWTDSDQVYGAPRITAELAERYGIGLNRKTVAKRMRLMGIEGISPRAFVPGDHDSVQA